MARLPVFRTCAKCGEQRITSLFRLSRGTAADRSGVCYVCDPLNGDPERAREALARDTEAKERAAKYEEARKSRAQKPVRARGRPAGSSSTRADQVAALLVSMEAADRFSEFIVSSVPPVLRCMCCRTTDELGLDDGGNAWCSLCGYYAFACGRCPPHHSPVFFPALKDNPVPPPPNIPASRSYTEVPPAVDDGLEP